MNMLMEIDPLSMRGSLMMMMSMISPFRREVPLAESLCRSAKVLLPKFRLETAALRPKSLLLFSKVYMKRDNADNWDSGLEKEKILETYCAQLQKS